MSHSHKDSILIYLADLSIVQIVEEFVKLKSLHLEVADYETDLIALPNLFIITDINKLTNETFDYINGFAGEGLFDDEMIISYTEPKTELAIKNSKYFEFKLDLSIQYLEEILPERILIRTNSELNETE